MYLLSLCFLFKETSDKSGKILVSKEVSNCVSEFPKRRHFCIVSNFEEGFIKLSLHHPTLNDVGFYNLIASVDNFSDTVQLNFTKQCKERYEYVTHE